jgi:hypothetical protein
LPVWTNAKNNIIIGLDGAEFADKALFKRGDVPGGLEYKGYISDEY